MNISNSDLKVLLSLHNYLPQYKEEQKFIDPEYIKAITRYEKILIKLLQQKIQENEETRYFLEKCIRKYNYGCIVSTEEGENHG